MNPSFAIILQEPENPGNIGAIARVMANFGVYNLYLINPACDHICEEALCRAKHGKEILQNATVCDQAPVDILVGTTARTGSDKNINRVFLPPQDFAFKANRSQGKIGILFGRESSGLTNEELSRCDFTVTIPTATTYPTLNISHACTIICYELLKEQSRPLFELPKKEEKEKVMKDFDTLLDNLHFMTEEKRTTQKKFWRRFLSKNFITRQELYIIFGFLKQIRRRF
ncbi:MAG: RNA methyltransferase [Nanobdellota archaeon]